MLKHFLIASVFVLSAAHSDELVVDAVVETALDVAHGVSLETVAERVEKAFEVKVSENEGKAIAEIVTTLGTTSLVGLGFKKGHLKSLGAGLKGIGTLHFLGYIFSNPELRAHMKTIRKSSLKWDGFLDGLKPGFETAYKSNKLL